MSRVTVVGAGLAGSEAAGYLARCGHEVTLYEQKPTRFSPAHSSDRFAELVCSNSFKAASPDTAAGLLKAELRLMGSIILQVADGCRVAAGGALAVDRELFSAGVTGRIESLANINVVREEFTRIDETVPTLIATGPLTEGALAQDIKRLCGEEYLSFFDAAAPIVTAESLDMSKISVASRYGRGEGDYLNCFFDKERYEEFWRCLCEAQTAELHGDDYKVYEGCMPIEKLAKRGVNSIRFGPLKPIGLTDPRTGRGAYAVVQLRREDAAGTLYNIVGFQTNLKFGEQKRVFSMIEGLENAEFARYGVMHRNTFLNSPKLLNPTLNLKSAGNVYFAGQITGFEGYIESAACGMLAARSLADALEGKPPRIPSENTMCGALLRYIAAENRDFQPMGANMGILPPLDGLIRDKRVRYGRLAERALKDMEDYIG